MKINLAEQIIDDKDIAQLINWLKNTKRYTKGPETILFEEEWSKWLGTEYSVLVNSGSSANLLMFLALLYSDRLKNKKVIVPAVSWVTTVSPAIQLGFESFICDCDKEDLGFDLEHFEQLCKEHNPAVAIAVHVLGHAGKLEQIKKICDKYYVNIRCCIVYKV